MSGPSFRPLIKDTASGADKHKVKGVLVGAALVLALMIVIKDGRVTRKMGLSGSCASVATPKGQTGHWVKCTSGKLQGAPGKVEYWRCPAPIQAGPNS
jgi:hypothetical protein